MTVSFRIRYAKLGGHVHAKVWSSEFGPHTTHGLNGTLVFRESEWPAYRAALAGRQSTVDDLRALARALRNGARANVARQPWWRRLAAGLALVPRPAAIHKAVALEAAAEAIARALQTAVVEFVEDPNAFSSSPFDPGGEAR